MNIMNGEGMLTEQCACGYKFPTEDEEDFGGDHSWDSPNHQMDWAKGWHEGTETMEDMVTIFRALANRYEQMITEGWILEQPVDNGHVFMVRPAVTGC